MADLFDKEVGMAVAATAALMSDRARGVLRRGAVYAIAGVMTAGEAVTSAAKSVGRDADRVTSNGRGESENVAERSPAKAKAETSS